jgi:hypothetical protein
MRPDKNKNVAHTKKKHTLPFVANYFRVWIFRFREIEEQAIVAAVRLKAARLTLERICLSSVSFEC